MAEKRTSFYDRIDSQVKPEEKSAKSKEAKENGKDCDKCKNNKKSSTCNCCVKYTGTKKK